MICGDCLRVIFVRFLGHVPYQFGIQMHLLTASLYLLYQQGSVMEMLCFILFTLNSFGLIDDADNFVILIVFYIYLLYSLVYLN